MVIGVEQQIYDCIDNGQSFILDAGAGSGKTWTLIQTIKHIIIKKNNIFFNNNQKIVCITYTNVAKNEIRERLEHNELVIVSTIHEFMWSCIGKYKKEVKEKLIEYLNRLVIISEDKIVNLENKIKIAKEKGKTTKTNEGDLKKENKKLEKLQISIKEVVKKEIIYKDYYDYNNGIISHNEVLHIAEKIFQSYPRINKIIADSFPVILVDEYQDTNELIIKLLCEYIGKQPNFLLGFYGDKMQKIYEGVGEINTEYNFRRVTKEENYRCSKKVIELLNKIRTDITQYPAGKNKDGSCNFYIYDDVENKSFDINTFIKKYIDVNWDKNNANDKLKILYLTHRFIARENGYLELFKLYNSDENPSYRRAGCITDNINNRGCVFANILFDIEEIYNLYKNNQIQLLLKNIDFEIKDFETRNKLKLLFEEFEKVRQKKIKDVIDFAFDEKNKLLRKPEKLENFAFKEDNNQSFHDEFIALDYNIFVKLYETKQKSTPFSTKHGVKGDEFENVLVVIDDSAWQTEYNFSKYFEGIDTVEKRFERTKNLFYVVCSRAKDNLYVLYLQNSKSKLSDEAITNIENWFGENNVHRLP